MNYIKSMDSESKKLINKLLLYILLFPLFIVIFDLVLSTLGVEIGIWLAMAVFISANLVAEIPLGYLTKFFMKKKEIKKLNYFLDIALFMITFNCKIWFAIWMFSIVGVDSSPGAVLFAFAATEVLKVLPVAIVIPVIALIKHLIKGSGDKSIEKKAS